MNRLLRPIFEASRTSNDPNPLLGADDVVVLFGDLITHHAVHAGRKAMGKAKRSLHVAGPARLPDVEEGSPAMAEHSGGSASITAAFMAALLSPRENDTSESNMEGAGSSWGGGAGAGGNQQGGHASFRSGGDANSRGGGTAGSEREASSSGGGPTGGSKDAHSSAGACDGGGERSVGGAESSSDGGGFDCDEGLLEAAQENCDAQVFLSVLRNPEVYKALGMSEPPTSFRPPTKEETLARFQPWED